MDFRILGPLEMRDGDRTVPLPSGKQKALLALLLVSSSRTIGVDRIVDELWGEVAPETAQKMVQIYVSRLRKVLPPETLRTQPPGYALELEPGVLDLDRFEQLVGAARAALADGRADEAAAGFRSALALWRGPALAEFGAEPFAEREGARLEELRLTTLEERLEADLLCGRHGDLVGELEALISSYPLREGLRRQHMLALYRSDRQAEALAAYQEARRVLADELGIEPSPALRELERRILQQDSSLELELLTPQAVTGRPAAARRPPLLERDEALAVVAEALDRATNGSGQTVLVLGEAGIGKTALVESVAAGAAGIRVLRGACDPLLTPRALGPIRDVSRQVGGPLEASLGDGSSREDVFNALIDELAGGGATLLVVEDAHWADEGTLDVLAFLGRRVAELPVALVVTARSETSEAGYGLLGALGELARGALTRVELAPLSEGAVAELARAAGRAPEGLYETTGGNPFFVTEVLAAGSEELPLSVRDAVLARCARLSAGAREAVELVSVVPGRVELTLAEALGIATAAVDESLSAGILVADGETLRFRHEIARRAVEETLSPPRRLALERKVLGELRVEEADVARLVHHARLAEQPEAVGRYAPIAARAASKAGAHREAVEHYRAALAETGALEPAERADLLEGLSVEAYLCDLVDKALNARRAAVVLREELGDPTALGASLRWLARLLWWSGASAEAEAVGQRAVSILEKGGPSRELAMALSGLSQLQMLDWRPAESIELGNKAIELARSLGDSETEAHALTNVGASRILLGETDEGQTLLGQAFALADAGGYHDHAARALSAHGVLLVEYRLPDWKGLLDGGIAYTEQHQLDGYHRYLLGLRALRRLDQGELEDAEADAREAISGRGRGISAFHALIALARLQARRGDAAAVATLDEVSALAEHTGEFQRTWPAAVARAEHAWLTGRPEKVKEHVQAVYERALVIGDPWVLGELAFWLWRADALEEVPTGAAEPYRLSIEGDWRGAADAWERLGNPFAVAEALAHGDENACRQAIERYSRLGASAAAERLRARLATAPRRPRREPVRYATTADDLSIAYQITGRGPIDLVLVPGFVSHLEKDWEEPRHAHFLDRLGSFSRLVRFDKRGTGLSDRPAGLPDLETRMDDVRAVMDTVGIERAVLFGYSEGVPMSILFAATYPDRVAALVLYGGYAKRIDPDDDYPWASTREARAAYIEQIGEEWGFESDMKVMCPSADDAMARWWAERGRAAASPGAVKALLEVNSLIDVRAVLPSVRVPTLVVHRGADSDARVDEGRYIADRIPGSRFVELTGADHFVAIDPDQILDVVEPFVLELSGGPAPVVEDQRSLATIFFTDIVGSTETAARLGDRAWADLLASHHDLVRIELARFSGEEIDTAGDGFLALFDGPSRGIRCGLAIRERSAELGLPVRIGLHTGEIERRGRAARGIAVHLAARAAAEALPGEVVVTATTRDLVAGSGLLFEDRGERLLKGFDEPRRLFAVRG